MEYVQDAFLVVVFILNGVGAMIKGVPKIPNWLIPIILLGLGIVAGVAVYGFTFDGFTQGAVSGLAAVGMHQTVTRTTQGSGQSKTASPAEAGGPAEPVEILRSPNGSDEIVRAGEPTPGEAFDADIPEGPGEVSEISDADSVEPDGPGGPG